MKLFSQLLVLGLAAEVTVASNWFSKAGMFKASTDLSHVLYFILARLACFLQASFRVAKLLHVFTRI